MGTSAPCMRLSAAVEHQDERDPLRTAVIEGPYIMLAKGILEENSEMQEK